MLGILVVILTLLGGPGLVFVPLMACDCGNWPQCLLAWLVAWSQFCW